MNRRGIAQLVVLWALLLLGTLAMSFAFSMRTEALASRNGMEGERAYFQARTGVERAIALLSSGAADNVLAVPVTGGEDGATYEARITSESGRIDINIVPEEPLKEILEKGGLSADEAEALADAILDWRDEDDRPRPKGAEEKEYASLTEPVRPRNGRLASVGELRYVRGVTPEFFTRFLALTFTVNNGTPGVNVNLAPVEVLRVVPGFTPELAERTSARREEEPFRSPVDLSSFLDAEGAEPSAVSFLSTAAASRVYTITSTGRAEGTVARVIRCTVVLRSGTNPVAVTHWEDNVPIAEEEG
ncbi:MAG TPA: hypothetical protein VIS30_08535 [Candidatus Deferrimicrobiaceae bacterium]